MKIQIVYNNKLVKKKSGRLTLKKKNNVSFK